MDEPGVLAEEAPETSVLFADLVGFTPIAARLPAVEVVRHLNEIFSRFDDLAGRRGVEKVKTIGDAYMAVAGLPIRRPITPTGSCAWPGHDRGDRIATRRSAAFRCGSGSACTPGRSWPGSSASAS